MRNQTWNQKGKLLVDNELYLEDGVLKVKDHITGYDGEPTEEEKSLFFSQPAKDPLVALEERVLSLEERLEKPNV